MNTGKTLFAQLMDFLPWTTFTRIVDRYGGDHRVRTLSCAEQYRSMAFAQLTYRESLRDIETCLSVHGYHMGFRQPVRRSTLADANERRDGVSMRRWPRHHPGEGRTSTKLGLGPIPSTPWTQPVRPSHHQGGVKIGSLRGNIPSFIHISDGKRTTFMPSSLGPGHLRRGSWLRRRPLCVAPSRGSRVTNIDAHRVYSADGSLDRHHLRDHLPGRLLHPSGLPRTCGASASRTPPTRWSSSPTTSRFRPPPSCALYKSRWQVELFFKLIFDQAVLNGERGEDADLDAALRPTSSVAIVKKRLERLALHFVTDPLGDPLRENAHTSSTCGRRKQMQRFANNQPIEFIRFLTGH